jgi:hypothetical protein
VIPSADEEAGEVPKAFVVLKGDVTPEAIMASSPSASRPQEDPQARAGARQIPKSPSGKILRRVLVEKERAGGSELRDLLEPQRAAIGVLHRTAAPLTARGSKCQHPLYHMGKLMRRRALSAVLVALHRRQR